MANDGGLFGTEEIDWFNGGLFDTGEVLPLTGSEISTLLEVSRLNWALIEPAIFGTLFERGLDPDQRAQLGAHYTDRDAIWKLVEPVILRPLRREFVAMQTRVTELLLSGRKVTKATPRDQDPNAVFEDFLTRLRGVRVLDPACGSGNFLIVSLWALKDLEFEAINWGSLVLRRPMQLPQIGPEAVLGIEINAYAAELARVTVWIGEIQWMIRHGLGYRRDPILKSLDHIENRDALLDLSDPANPKEAEWPEAEFIVGNPPFLGGKLMRRGLGDDYVDTLFRVFDGRVPREADFVTYWHEKARAQIERGAVRRAGLLATQGIRGGANRKVLERIKETGDIFFARSDDPWILSGATVHISFVGQDDGADADRELDGQPTSSINPNLTTGIDLSRARRAAREPRHLLHGRHEGRPIRHRCRDRGMAAGAAEPRRAIERAMSFDRGSTASTSPDARGTCGSSTSVSTCLKAKQPSTRRLSSTFASTSDPSASRTPAPPTQSGGGCTSKLDQECAAPLTGSIGTSQRRT